MKSLHWLNRNGRWVRQLTIQTPSLLLLDRLTHAEALHELRKKPLRIDHNISDCLTKGYVTLFDLIPLALLEKIKHVALTDDSLKLLHLQDVLWHGFHMPCHDVACHENPDSNRVMSVFGPGLKWQLETLHVPCGQKRPRRLDFKSAVLVSGINSSIQGSD